MFFGEVGGGEEKRQPGSCFLFPATYTPGQAKEHSTDLDLSIVLISERDKHYALVSE